MQITQQSLRELFHYEPETGRLVRLLRCGSRGAVGSEAGNIAADGYRMVTINGKPRSAHRLIWLYVFGEMPSDSIDHIDGNRANNALGNLREATYAENNQNRRNPNKNNTSGFLGVFFHKRLGKYVAKIKLNNKVTNLGGFENHEDASAAYLAAKKQLHPFQTIV